MKVYPRENAIAEKLDAMIELGMKNSRMKDYHDIALLARHFAFEGSVLREAIHATLKRRGRRVPPGVPTGLTEDFGSEPSKSVQWAAFLRGHRAPELPTDLLTVVRMTRGFLEPVLGALRGGSDFDSKWPAGGPWQWWLREVDIRIVVHALHVFLLLSSKILRRCRFKDRPALSFALYRFAQQLSELGFKASMYFSVRRFWRCAG